ncbi:LDH2 family malate/lactate/ureidoglycolate dehydrogenase [Salinibacter ruber]|uniref:ribbon-helix-helix protein, CopG family n=1 Tax=Salinibacter ruber TaxID=146919 RepID=UPI00216A27ED|nr:ribbon-helix-helix protein, CopG family [Salinibacter ruber]MCS3831234.1 LDH2 family malate/lactate/ureidoglycolate dehydrogenase [Salinibacter ruber]
MADGSNPSNSRKDDFLGLYVTTETKERVERKAEAEGVSISEAVRRRIRDVDAENQ